MALAQPPLQLVQTIHIGESAIRAQIANTPALREQGLSGRATLSEGEGMLFVFEADGAWGIWMKDMHFAIDIVFADHAGTVTTIIASVSPDTYPQVFYPTAPARYVLEVPAGFVKNSGIIEGVKLEF